MKTILEKPIEIYNKTIPNRIVFHPMEGCDGTKEGAVDTLTFDVGVHKRHDLRPVSTDDRWVALVDDLPGDFRAVWCRSNAHWIEYHRLAQLMCGLASDEHGLDPRGVDSSHVDNQS